LHGLLSLRNVIVDFISINCKPTFMKSFMGLFLFCCFGFSSCSTKSVKEDQKVDTTTSTKEIEGNDSTRTLVLKWKSVSSSEWGNAYEFEDQSGNVFTAYALEIPGLSKDDNDYFTSAPVEGTPFARYEIKDAVKENWFDVKIYTRQEENEQAGDGSMKDVEIIVGIKPHQ
jgi:hypothetical protein